VLATRARLRETGVDRAHLKGVKTVIGEQGGAPTVTYTDALCLSSDTSQHDILVAIYTEHGGDLAAVAAAVNTRCTDPPYHVSEAQLLGRAPKTAKQFAWQCVEGYYLAEGAPQPA
jgi:hypothetical protein